MASNKSTALVSETWRDRARMFNNNRKNPRETRARDRSLRGKQRRLQRKADNKA